MRSLALTRLGRPDEAWTAANSALALAKKQRLPYELALTLLVGSDLQQIPETLDTGMSKEAATEILTGLGVVRTPKTGQSLNFATWLWSGRRRSFQTSET